jgi:haloalkane dehalogenase
MHYLDEGPRDGQIVLMLHGEPSWCYLYRKMIPAITAAGYRAIAPDLIGFGRSDKPAERSDYTYQRHVDWVRSFLTQTDLQDITLICQDWGGLIGLRLVAEHPDRFARVIVANTGLPTGDRPLGPAFDKWRDFSQTVPEFPAGGIIQGGTVMPMSAEVRAAYDAPFPDETYKAGARQFPTLVPATPADPARKANLAAWESLMTFEKPFLTAFSDKDQVMAGGEKVFQKLVPGCAGQPHTIIRDGGHFLQEDQGEVLAKVAVDFIAAT